MLKSLCVIGVKDYNLALKMILASLDLLRDCKAQHRTGPGPGPGVEESKGLESRENAPHACLPGQGSVGCSGQGEVQKGNTSFSPTDFALLMRCEWILSYHSALCSYHTGRYAKALQVRHRSSSID
jgi:hypothetical protein